MSGCLALVGGVPVRSRVGTQVEPVVDVASLALLLNLLLQGRQPRLHQVNVLSKVQSRLDLEEIGHISDHLVQNGQILTKQKMLFDNNLSGTLVCCKKWQGKPHVSFGLLIQ